MVHVADAETWAKRMEKEIAQGREVTPALLLDTVDNGLSGYQACYAYQIIRIYWIHRNDLPWESFLDVPTRRLRREPTRIRRYHPKRKPRAYH